MLKILALIVSLLAAPAAYGQSVNAGTVDGTVVDPTGAAVALAKIHIHNPLTGYEQSATSDSNGVFKLNNLPPNSYHLDITAPGFAPFSQEVVIRNQIPVQVKAALALASSKTEVTVEASAEALETDSSSHTDVDRSGLSKLPLSTPGSGLSDAITLSTGAVAADANGFFHPAGDHAEATFVIDGQPISDQQSKVFSTQLPVSAIQSMELVTGAPGADLGDKTSLTAEVTTRSGLGAGKFFGNVDATYGNFGTQCAGCRATEGGSIGLGWGNAKFGNFFAADGVDSGRFLDTPEYLPIHDQGNNQSLFDRLDFQPTGTDTLHLNLFAARNWIQIPNDYDQLEQDQRQRVLTWSVAPGYQHTFNSTTLLTINPYVRKDQFNYYPSRDIYDDFPATQSQQRQLLNWGVKADLSATRGIHNIKYGVDLKQTRLLENFQFGITDPTFNSPCVNTSGDGIADASLTTPSQCAALGYQPNVEGNPYVVGMPFSASLLPYDLTRGGSLFIFHSTANINQYAAYITDAINKGNWSINLGLRLDRYDGLVSATSPQPRVGLAYNIKKTGTVLRAAYSRTLETPFNENLLLSSANVLGGTGGQLNPGNRNQFNAGFQQALFKFLLIDADYFWKYTHNAYDFNALLNSTITFPIEWHNSKLDGVTGRISTTNLHGFQAYWTVGHTRARYFPPETGGLVFQGTPLTEGVFRIDHDQALQSTMNLRYQHKKFEWIALTYRYDNGLVVSGVPDAGAALALTPNQQVTLGLACNGVPATVVAPLTNCVNPNGTEGLLTSKLITLPQGGYGGFPSQENDDHNPDRVKPRNVFDLGFGTDNITHREGTTRFTVSLDIANLTNKVALYNFLSTFSGTHFLEPRTVTARVGLVF